MKSVSLLEADCGTFSVLSKSDSNNTILHYRNYKNSNKYRRKNIFEQEIDWQEMTRHTLNELKKYYKTLIHSRRRPERQERFFENPLYFNDYSFAMEDNGYGDHYLYGLYAGWPHVFMRDMQGYFNNRDEFLKLSVERHLSHKNSLLSSASTTEIVSRIDKDMCIPSVLNLLRPKDPLVKKSLLDRHATYVTSKKDHNREAFCPYVASVNFPPRFPIKIEETDPFPESLEKLALKQHRKRMMIAPFRKPLSIFRKPRVFTKHVIFPKRPKTETVCSHVDVETQIMHEHKYPNIPHEICDSKRQELNELIEWKQNFINDLRIPLYTYQYSLLFQEPRPKFNYRGFYDMQPKVESPWLSKMIRDGKFTRKYYLENFRGTARPDRGVSEIRGNILK